MKIEATHFVVMDKNKSLFLVNEKTGALSKMPSQAKRFNTFKQAEASIQATYKLWKDEKSRFFNPLKFRDFELETLRIKTTHELLPRETYPF